jgi:hypothetical protein
MITPTARSTTLHGKFFEFVEHGQPQSLADFSSLENLVWFRAASLGSLAGMAKADEARTFRGEEP